MPGRSVLFAAAQTGRARKKNASKPKCKLNPCPRVPAQLKANSKKARTNQGRGRRLGIAEPCKQETLPNGIDDGERAQDPHFSRTNREIRGAVPQSRPCDSIRKWSSSCVVFAPGNTTDKHLHGIAKCRDGEKGLHTDLPKWANRHISSPRPVNTCRYFFRSLCKSAGRGRVAGSC